MTILYVVLILGSAMHTFEAVRTSKGGQCGEDTVLTCATYGEGSGYWEWFILSEFLTIRGTYNETVHIKNKYTAYVENNILMLIIHNTNAVTDDGFYECGLGSEYSLWIHLLIECKASSAHYVLKDDKKLEITVDKVNAENAEMNVTLDTEAGLSAVHGETSCKRSYRYRKYVVCKWHSSNSLQDGYQNVSVVVTTLTDANPLPATILIAAPDIPKIENACYIQSGAEVIFGAISNNLTVTCTSEGGSPRQTVVLYIDSVSIDNELAISSYADSVMKEDDTNTVTIKYIFLNVDMSLHGRTLICQSYYPKADIGFQGSKLKSVMIHIIETITTEGVFELPPNYLIGGFVGGLSVVIVIAFVVVVFAYRRTCCFGCRTDSSPNQQENLAPRTTPSDLEYENLGEQDVPTTYEMLDSRPSVRPVDVEYEHIGEHDAHTTAYEIIDSGINTRRDNGTSTRHEIADQPV